MTAIIDYGVGNLFSLASSFEKIGEKAIVTADCNMLAVADRIILPGVGAFSDAAEKLKNSGMLKALLCEIKNGKPVMGICLGMQLLFDKSYEYGEFEGLGIISGKVVPITEKVKDLKVPHMGWNALEFKNGTHPLFKYIKNGDYVYFVHSYYAECDEKSLIATSEYGIDITAAVANKNVMGCQFHPEKSGDVGLNILRAFCEMKAGAIC